MKYLQHQLDNGLQIVADCNPNAHALAVGFFVRTGARDEPPGMGGVSHFLEHMVFKGTPNRTAEQVNHELDEMGSHSNARTSEESTIYHAAVLAEFQTPIVELLSDLMRPSLRDDDFDTEKQVIVEEIKMYDDQPPYGGHERIMAEFFGQHPLSQSVLGTIETVTGLTAAQMADYFRRRYSPANMAVAAAGRVDFERLVDDCQRCCGSWQCFDAPRENPSAQPHFGFVTMHKPEATQQYIIQLAQGPACSDDDRYAARVLTTVLGDDSGSRCYWEFIDSGLAEAAGMANYEYDDSGVVLTFLCCTPTQAQDNLNRLRSLQQRARSEPVTQHELDLAKSKIAAHIILAAERTENRMFSAGTQWLKRMDYKSPKQIAELYERVTLDEVNAVLEKYPLINNMTVCVGPETQLTAPD